MNNLNSVLLEGNLNADPDLQHIHSGAKSVTPICTLIVATTRSYGPKKDRTEEVSFIEVRVFNKLATVCSDYLKKGRGVCVVGRLKQVHCKDGSRIVVDAEHIEFKPAFKDISEEYIPIDLSTLEPEDDGGPPVILGPKA